MPRPGGEADKLGNRYEALWVVDAVLDLIEGHWASLVLEPVGQEAAGIEFSRTSTSGLIEFHSIKRQHHRGNWTIALLAGLDPTGRCILGDLFQQIQTGAEAVFSSGTSATELEELIQRALASDSFEEFKQRISQSARLSGQFLKYVAAICDAERPAYRALRHLHVRTKNEPELRKDVERRIRSRFGMRSGEPLNATTTQLLIGNFLTDSLGRILNAESILEALADHGIVRLRLTHEPTVGERIQRLNRAYLHEVNALLINHAMIVRSESVAACTALLDDGRSVTLEGTAGGGKSCVLAQVLSQLDDRDVPFLVIRLDRLTEADVSAQAIGVNRGLPDSPTITLGEFAGDRPSVLCLDQLDALSLVSARQLWAWSALSELLDEASRYPTMRILFACRSFDLEQDAQIRALAANEDQIERVRIQDLDEDTVQSAIAASRLVVPPLEDQQLQILSIPLHLYIFLVAARSGQVDFAAAGDLFDAFWKAKALKVARRISSHAPAWSPAVSALCRVMSERESLAVPEYLMDEYSEAMDALASEAVVYVQDGNIRFFHESFFDYSFARTFLREDNDFVEWLASDEQHLFRRSQVRQVLAFLRDREPDRSRYRRTLSGLLGRTQIRFHIKKLVLNWLGALPDPTADEWTIVEGLELELEGHAWNVIRNSVPWFDVLRDMGRWECWLNADEQQVDRAMWLLSMAEVLDRRSAVVVALLAPFREQSDAWRNRLQLLMQRGHGHTSPEMQDFVIDLIADGTLNDANPGVAMNDDWWSIWYESSTERPAFTARVLGAWFDRQLHRAANLGRDDPFSGDLEMAPYSQLCGYVISECAAHAPRKFVRELFPRFARFARFDVRVPEEWIAAPSRIGSPDQQLRNALAEAMASLAQDDPAELDSIMDAERLSQSKWMSALFLRAWSANPSVYAERIVRFLLDRPNDRLNIGYSSWTQDIDAFAAVSRIAVAAASTSCSDQSFVELEGAILDFTLDRELRSRMVGRTRLTLLRALAPDRIGEGSRRQIQELERKFPEATEHGAPEPPSEDDIIQSVGPPIPAEALRRMSDDHWLSAMSKYTGDQLTERNGDLVSGAPALAWELTKLVREDPARFAALVGRMDVTHPTTYFEAILRGLTGNERGPSRPGTLGQVCSVLHRIAELGVSVNGKEVAHAIATLSDEPVPDDIVHMLCLVALEDPDPEEDNWQGDDDETAPVAQAIDSARGAAAVALARILFADGSRWPGLKPTIERLATDRVLAVRSVAVDCLLAVLDVHRCDALTCFQELTVGAEPILGTDTVERFLNYAMFREYPAIRPILLRMLSSSLPVAVRAGARVVALASLRLDEARDDAGLVLEAGERARLGAAEIYARNLSNETVGAECEQKLRTLFRDESEAVRQEAGKCWLALEPDAVAARGSLVGAFAQAMEADDRIGILLNHLQEARLPVPIEVCDLAERAVATYGSKASSVHYRAGAADRLARLMVRLYGQTNDRAVRTRVLNAIDDMIREGFMGVDEQLEQHYDR